MTPRNFSRAELIRSQKAQELKIDNTPPESVTRAMDLTLAGLERIRAFLRLPMKIHSGYRCPELNKAVGGAPNSQHMLGEAVDFTCPAFGTPAEVAKALAPMRYVLGIDQLILEPSWVHVSITLEPKGEVLHWTQGRYREGLDTV